jgi:hypothetical protein
MMRMEEPKARRRTPSEKVKMKTAEASAGTPPPLKRRR